ncbi:hypothetical protein DOJK_00874 [Patescibacteria group bacterium]|nr:hypothetical protein DOJK_00874 [Patescibacteria group bacterium]
MKLIKNTALILTISLSSIWSILAIYLGNSETSVLQTSLAILFSIFSLFTLILIFTRWKKAAVINYFTSFIIIMTVWIILIQPSNNRFWQTDVAKLPYADINGNLITVHNIRHFNYKSEFDYTPAYYDKTFDLTKLVGVDLFAVYWMGDAIAHTILSFNFDNTDYLAISIEARKEQNEAYSTFKGFFRQYELIYIVADERDVIGLRTNYRKDPKEDVYLYSLKPNQENGQQLFLEYIKHVNQLHEHAQFYNTLIDNCTTSIWFNTLVNENHLPFSWKILLSGYVPEYLYESGRLNTNLPFNELKQKALINPIAEKLDLSSEDFSKKIRTTK